MSMYLLAQHEFYWPLASGRVSIYTTADQIANNFGCHGGLRTFFFWGANLPSHISFPIENIPSTHQLVSELAQLVRQLSPVQATRVRFPVGASNPGCPIVEKGSMYTAELMTFPASAPQLVYQRPWYVLLCLCSSAYKRSPVTLRKEQGIVSR